MDALPAYMCVAGGQEGQKRVWDRLELELQMVVKQHQDAGN